MFLAGKRYHKYVAVFCWVIRGGFYGFVLWEAQTLWVEVMEVTLVLSASTDESSYWHSLLEC
jgi:hypothetical protein